MIHMSKGEKIFLFIIIIFAALMYWHATTLVTPMGADYIMGPTKWPKTMLLGAIFLSLIVLVMNWKKKPKEEPTSKEEEEEEKPNRLRAALVLLVCFIYTFAMKYIGFLFATPLFVAAILYVCEYRKIRTYFITPIMITIVFHLVFVWLAGVLMPRGHWIFRDLSLLLY
jgi:putative tricarboxylic transport membrane protein